MFQLASCLPLLLCLADSWPPLTYSCIEYCIYPMIRIRLTTISVVSQPSVPRILRITAHCTNLISTLSKCYSMRQFNTRPANKAVLVVHNLAPDAQSECRIFVRPAIRSIDHVDRRIFGCWGQPAEPSLFLTLGDLSLTVTLSPVWPNR